MNLYPNETSKSNGRAIANRCLLEMQLMDSKNLVTVELLVAMLISCSQSSKQMAPVVTAT